VKSPLRHSGAILAPADVGLPEQSLPAGFAHQSDRALASPYPYRRPRHGRFGCEGEHAARPMRGAAGPIIALPSKRLTIQMPHATADRRKRADAASSLQSELAMPPGPALGRRREGGDGVGGLRLLVENQMASAFEISTLAFDSASSRDRVLGGPSCPRRPHDEGRDIDSVEITQEFRIPGLSHSSGRAWVASR